jgi:hypothetical protein
VTGRERVDTGSAVNTGSGTVSGSGYYTGTGVSIGFLAMRVRCIIRAGSYERAITGEGGSYRRAARDVLDRLMVWIEAIGLGWSWAYSALSFGRNVG